MIWSRKARWRRQAYRILRAAKRLESLEDAALRREMSEATFRARGGESLQRLLTKVYALAIEATRRTAGMTHFPVQVMGAIALFEGHIAEMQTGEGKTITAILPAALRSLMGKGVHVITANDYLASRDAEKLSPIYAKLGLTVGCVIAKTEGQDKSKREGNFILAQEDDDRRDAYACDVTYGTASEMGFDFLRDRLRRGAGVQERAEKRQPAIFEKTVGREAPVQRGHYCALIDEADSILIDEARTPLIIGVMQANREAMVSLYRWCAGAIRHLEPGVDFLFDPHKRRADLTDQGCRRVTLLAKPAIIDTIDTERIYQHVEKALMAALVFERDRDYVIHKDEIVIVDEGTGRKMDGRKWQEGQHQSVEAKERLPITEVTSSAARITIQTLFRYYEHLSGMTGTAVQARGEFSKVYGLKVTVIPTNRPCIRRGMATRVFRTQDAKREAIVEEIDRLVRVGRAVLVGTPSVESSESLSEALLAIGVEHEVLNARFDAQEADIVSRAGTSGKVTIATNMAGRGTDILLEEPTRKAGGLHVIATEMHTSRRIDRQLVGRAARQGDPGSFQFFLSLEDELFRVLKVGKREKLIKRAWSDRKGELNSSWERYFRRIQRGLEKLHTKQRKRLLKFEREQSKRYRKLGLDPFLELAEA
ncbi:MAG: translocase [Planctomycetaceae bacterium]|nr:translocase [Planctomycetaceae bacterium]